MPEDANMYRVVYGQDGIFFYIMKNVGAEDSNSQQLEYDFYYQTFDEDKVEAYFTTDDFKQFM